MKIKFRLVLFTVIFLISWMSSGAYPDTIYLRNGRNIEGLIKKEDGKSVLLDVGFGTVKFRREEIKDISRSSREEAFNIRKGWGEQRKLEEERMSRRKKELEKTRQKKEFEPKEARFIQDKNKIVVEALLNKKVKASLLLDTGATVVLLSSGVARRLRIRKNTAKKDMVKVQMADGRKVNAQLIVLNTVSVEGAKAKDVEAVVLSDYEGMGAYDGLLGMSFLNRFNFQIDTVNKRLILKRRR